MTIFVSRFAAFIRQPSVISARLIGKYGYGFYLCYLPARSFSGTKIRREASFDLTPPSISQLLHLSPSSLYFKVELPKTSKPKIQIPLPITCHGYGDGAHNLHALRLQEAGKLRLTEQLVNRDSFAPRDFPGN